MGAHLCAMGRTWRNRICLRRKSEIVRKEARGADCGQAGFLKVWHRPLASRQVWVNLDRDFQGIASMHFRFALKADSQLSTVLARLPFEPPFAWRRHAVA